MNRAEFMTELERLLSDVPQTEREEALQYYNDYFEDAGAEKEQEIIENLGNPAKVAETIKKDMAGQGAAQEPPKKEREVVPYISVQEKAPDSLQQEKNKQMPTWLAICLGVLFSPVIFAVTVAAVAVLFALIVTWFCLVCAFGIVAVVMLAAMVYLLWTGFLSVWAHPFAGLTLFGSAFLVGGIGMLFLGVTSCMVSFTPFVLHWLFRRRWKKRG